MDRSPSSPDRPKKEGTICVRVLEGRNLAICEKTGSMRLSEPSTYAIVSIGSASQKTKLARNLEGNPNWQLQKSRTNEKEEFKQPEPMIFHVNQYSPSYIIFDIYDYHVVRKHKRMGRHKIPISQLLDGNEFNDWLTLKKYKEKDKVSGEIHVSIKFEDESLGRQRSFSKVLARYEDEPPLFVAIKESNLSKVQEILREGVSINQKDMFGYTPLHAACCVFSESDDKILSLLLNQPGIDVNNQNNDKNTPLHYFCEKFRSPNCTYVFEIFIEKGAKVNIQNRIGETPLHKAIFNNSVRILMTNLLISHGANVNQGNKSGETALHYSVRLGRVDLVTILLKAGANLYMKGLKGQTPYDIAIEGGHEMKIASFLKHASDLFTWLRKLKLEKYRAAFLNEGMYIDKLKYLDEHILDEMNISESEDRKIILNAVREFKNRVEKDSSFTSFHEPVTRQEEFENLQAMCTQDSTWLIDKDDLEYTVKIGSGGSGDVFKGLLQGKEVAIKVLRTNVSPKQLRDFKKEFETMSVLRTPYTVFFFGACLEPRICMVMEYCAHSSLYAVMNDPHLAVDLGWDKVFNFAEDAVRGIEVLHSRDPPLIHRDIKSLNLLISENWHLKIGDFGLSRVQGIQESQSSLSGTLAFSAPEVYFEQGFSTKSDVYAFAFVLWELSFVCTQRHYERPYQEYPQLVFDFQIAIQAAKKHLRPTLPKILPKPLAALIEKCWAHDPDERPSSKQLLQALEKLQREYEGDRYKWDKVRDPPLIH